MPSGVDEFQDVGERELHEALPILARSGLPLLVHAESPGLIAVRDPQSAQVVILDENPIVKPQPMIMSTSTPYRVLLDESPPGRGSLPEQYRSDKRTARRKRTCPETK